MRAAVLRGMGRLAAEDWPRPEVRAGELLVGVRGCGLCGSDIGKILAPPGSAPLVLGHEVVGDVLEVGAGAPFTVGTRVVTAHHVPCEICHYCRRGSASMCAAFKRSNLDPGGFAEYVRVPAANARHATFALPAGLGDEAASFTEPLACCLRAVKRARVTEGDTALVIGLGSIGLLFVQLLTRAGGTVIGADVLAARAALARRLGAAAAGALAEAAAAVREASAGRGADLVVVTGGGAAVLGAAATAARDGGAIHVFAGGEGESLPVALDTLYRRELTITATYSSSPAELREAFALIAAGAVRTDELITHRLPLARLAEGVDLMRRREALKVYVTP